MQLGRFTETRITSRPPPDVPDTSDWAEYRRRGRPSTPDSLYDSQENKAQFSKRGGGWWRDDPASEPSHSGRRDDDTRGRAGLGSRRVRREKQVGQVRNGGRPQVRVNRTG